MQQETRTIYSVGSNIFRVQQLPLKAKTLFAEHIQQVLAIQNKKCLMPTTTEEMLLDSLFNLLTVKFTYNTTSKAVRKIAKNM